MRLYLRAVLYFRPDWPLVLMLLALIAVATGLGLLVPWPMAVLLDSVLVAHPSTDRLDLPHRLLLAPLPQSTVGRIVVLATLGLVLKVANELLAAAQAVVSHCINYNGLLRVRRDLYRKLQALSLSYHRSQPQGDAIYRLSHDTFGCQAILGAFISIIVAIVTLAAMVGVLLSCSVPLTLLALGIVPPLMIVNLIFGRRLKQRSLECKESDARFTTVVQRSMASIGLAQAFGREHEDLGRFDQSIQGVVRAWWGLNRQQLIYNVLIGAIFASAGAIIFGYGGYLVWRDQFVRGTTDGMTVGSLIIFTSYVGMLWGPLCTLTGFAANVQGGAAGAQRVFEVLDRDVLIKDAPDAAALECRPRRLELRDITFSYDQNRPVIDGISVSIEPGQMVAFVGRSGAGKSTLLNLLPRFYDPTSGTMLLDGIDARTIRLADLRKHVALVLQESIILPTTIGENIAYGRTNATLAQIRNAAQLAGAAEFIERLPAGYDTPVAEGGANLSGGQRQRISIARALLTEAPFVVLDEPTSALDPHHEAVVRASLRALKGQRTIIIVTHRLAAVADCDWIYVLDAGRIIEQGSHEQLLQLRGAYSRMTRGQNVPGDVPSTMSAAA